MMQANQRARHALSPSGQTSIDATLVSVMTALSQHALGESEAHSLDKLPFRESNTYANCCLIKIKLETENLNSLGVKSHDEHVCCF